MFRTGIMRESELLPGVFRNLKEKALQRHYKGSGFTTRLALFILSLPCSVTFIAMPSCKELHVIAGDNPGELGLG